MSRQTTKQHLVAITTHSGLLLLIYESKVFISTQKTKNTNNPNTWFAPPAPLHPQFWGTQPKSTPAEFVVYPPPQLPPHFVRRIQSAYICRVLVCVYFFRRRFLEQRLFCGEKYKACLQGPQNASLRLSRLPSSTAVMFRFICNRGRSEPGCCGSTRIVASTRCVFQTKIR